MVSGIGRGPSAHAPLRFFRRVPRGATSRRASRMPDPVVENGEVVADAVTAWQRPKGVEVSSRVVGQLREELALDVWWCSSGPESRWRRLETSRLGRGSDCWRMGSVVRWKSTARFRAVGGGASRLGDGTRRPRGELLVGGGEGDGGVRWSWRGRVSPVVAGDGRVVEAGRRPWTVGCADRDDQL